MEKALTNRAAWNLCLNWGRSGFHRKEIVGNRGYYFDPDHLNQAGAHDFAIWLAQQIAELTGKD